MDDPQLARECHQRALRGLARINRWSHSVGLLWRAIRRHMPLRTTKPWRILDVASGGGDVSLGLYWRAQRAKIAVEIVGLDCSPTAVGFAQTNSGATGGRVQFHRQDVLAESLPTGFDIVTCSLFLHHLNDAQSIHLLTQMAAATNHLVLVNDLRRSRYAYLLAQTACQLLTRSEIVHVDGPRSVLAAYTRSELVTLAAAAGLEGAQVTCHWPARLRLFWEKS